MHLNLVLLLTRGSTKSEEDEEEKMRAVQVHVQEGDDEKEGRGTPST